MPDQDHGPRRAVTVVGRQPGGRQQVLIDKELVAQLTVTELVDQLLEAGLDAQLAETVTEGMRSLLLDLETPIGHA